mgnify:CR=1 FL=1
MWAETFSGTKLKRPIEYEICGTEGVTLVGPDTHTFNILYRDKDVVYGGNIGPGSHVFLDLSIFNNKFISDSPTCPIREWDLFDSDGVTPLID